jgi:hypothetical protein
MPTRCVGDGVPSSSGRSWLTTRSSPPLPTRAEPCTSRRATGVCTESMHAGASCAGMRRPFLGSDGASTSTRRRRWRTDASSSGTRMGPSTHSEPRADTSSGRARSGPTSTRRLRSGKRWSSSAPGTGRSSRSTRAPASPVGASTLRRGSRGRRLSSQALSISQRAGGAEPEGCAA